MTHVPNTPAVMAGRIEPKDSLDDFPTPPWAGRALIEHVLKPFGLWDCEATCWEPACNRGSLGHALDPYFMSLLMSDIHGYGSRWKIRDYLDLNAPGRPRQVDWVITNPPFRLAQEFALQGLQDARKGVALLVRTQWAEGVMRAQALFNRHPPTLWAVFSERVPMVKGRVDPKASTATSYSWVVWSKPVEFMDQTRMIWIPPCRQDLERVGDYPESEGSLI